MRSDFRTGARVGGFLDQGQGQGRFSERDQCRISRSGSGFGTRVGVAVGFQDRVTGSNFVAKIGVGLHDKEPRLGFRSKVKVWFRYRGQGWVSVRRTI